MGDYTGCVGSLFVLMYAKSVIVGMAYMCDLWSYGWLLGGAVHILGLHLL